MYNTIETIILFYQALTEISIMLIHFTTYLINVADIRERYTRN